MKRALSKWWKYFSSPKPTWSNKTLFWREISKGFLLENDLRTPWQFSSRIKAKKYEMTWESLDGVNFELVGRSDIGYGFSETKDYV